MKKSIHQLKYGYSEELGKILGNLLKTTIDQEFDYVLPVPVHKKRRKERGFNQAELIAKQLPFALNTGLKKTRHTKSQMTLKRKQRLTNLANSFAYDNQLDLEGKKLLLVDDVYTTGATINEIKEMLEKYGPKEIWAATLAKGED